MYPHACTVKKRTAVSPDAYGETAYTWATDSTQPSPTPCHLYHTDAGEEAVRPVSGETVRDILKANLPPTATVAKHAYRITTTEPGYVGTYEIRAVRRPSTPYGAVDHYEVELAEVA